jgi:deazaflavin-dependent oxidoreductase (nitroreductase family)
MRTNPVAVVRQGGKRWVVSTFGDTNWARNLRAAGEGVITSGRRRESVHAVELSSDEAADFFTHVLVPYVGHSWMVRMVLGALASGDILDDPVAAASIRPVFELR